MTSARPTAAEILSGADCLVLKVGSALLNGPAGEATLHYIADEVASQHRAGRQICVVSSGSVALGRAICPALKVDGGGRAALSALGQVELIGRWQAALGKHQIPIAQVLLTRDVTTSRHRYVEARNTLRMLMSNGIVPVVNENDAVAEEGVSYGDNDRLAAMAAGILLADALVLLTDVDGLYTDNPNTSPEATHIDITDLSWLTDEDTARMTPTSGVGRGGMSSKVEAARLARSWGISTIIAKGQDPSPLREVAERRRRATLVPAGPGSVPARQRWLEGLHPTQGIIEIDDGAGTALKAGKSLLAVGVTDIPEHFTDEDVVTVRCADEIIGYGVARVASADFAPGDKTVVIHCDDLVLRESPL